MRMEREKEQEHFRQQYRSQLFDDHFYYQQVRRKTMEEYPGLEIPVYYYSNEKLRLFVHHQETDKFYRQIREYKVDISEQCKKYSIDYFMDEYTSSHKAD